MLVGASLLLVVVCGLVPKMAVTVLGNRELLALTSPCSTRGGVS